MVTLEQICIDLQEIHARTNSWEKAARKYGINKAMARLIARGYKPGLKIRKRLGLPVMIPAPACPNCGGVHVSRRCPDKRKPPTRWADMPVKQVLRALRERQEL